MSVVPVGCARPDSGVGGFGSGSFCSDIFVGPQSGEGKTKYLPSIRLLSALMLLCGKCNPHQRQMKGSPEFPHLQIIQVTSKKEKQSGKWMNTLKKKEEKQKQTVLVCIIFQ